ncbi:MAG: AbrB/MazE/SpoVT family DNA-binding domain-containing protein [Deltaproteobacteria bacterium]|nr:AbrB/MazE/SpoVT family DNA-binding domain-containing protein [Deltaproteobacteria bacterium]
MPNLAITKMSSKGRVVIPEGIRKNLGLQTGAQFIVISDKDVVILKAITSSWVRDLDVLMADARRRADKAAVKRLVVAGAIAKVRERD